MARPGSESAQKPRQLAAKRNRTKPARKPKAKPRAKSARRTVYRNNKPTGTGHQRFRLSGWFWLLSGVSLVVGLFLLVGYLQHLNTRIDQQFADQRWSLPARVYAKPWELYASAPLTPEQLIQRLRFLNYQSVTTELQPGQYRRQGSQIDVYTRAFHTSQGLVSEKPLAVQFRDGFISQLRQGQQAIDLAQLEPAQITSFFPSHHEDRELIRLEQAPPSLLDTLIAVEDQQFYSHHGIQLSAIFRALWVNLRAGETRQGGSTLTQQLVKNYFLSNERRLLRKINEALMALLLERRYSKAEILQAYLNEVYLGQDGSRAIHGFALGSQFYFNQPLNQLRIEQLALLVGMIKGPSYYNPRRYPERAIERRNIVLSQLEKQGLLTTAQAQQARLRPLGTGTPRTQPQSYPAYMDLVKRQLDNQYTQALHTEGTRIFTTMDPLVQQQLERSVSQSLAALDDNLQAAAVILSAQNGEVVAMVGDRNPRYAGYNRALDSQRPIGSLVKPFVFMTALQQPERYTLTTQLKDTPYQYTDAEGKVWQPQNYDQRSHGQVSLLETLVQSYNMATARLGMAIGVEQVVDNLYRMGLNKRIAALPSVLLGSVELSPLEVAQMYQTLAAGGFHAPASSLRGVATHDYQWLQQYPLRMQQAVESEAVYLTTKAMQQVVSQGTARRLGQQLPALQIAGKTGTSNDFRDSWFAGFTQDYVVVVWVGRDDNQSTGLTGATGALPVWLNIVRELSAQPLQVLQPGGVTTYWVDAEGALSAESCPDVRPVPYINGSEPKTRAACLQKPGWRRWVERLLGG